MTTDLKRLLLEQSAQLNLLELPSTGETPSSLRRVVLILYGNEAHSEVPSSTYLKMVQPHGDLDVIFSAFERHHLPVVWSTQGVDIDLLSSVNPGLLVKLAASRIITPLCGLYTHALPSFFPEHLDTQLYLGREAFERHGFILPPVGMLPEFDVYPAVLPILKAAGWEFVLLQRGVNTAHEGERKCDATFQSLRLEIGTEMMAINTHGPVIRGPYLEMLRGLTPPETVVAKLAEIAETPLAAFLIDLEAIQLNDALPTFLRFVECLASAHEDHRIRLCGFQPSDLLRLRSGLASFSPPVTRLSARPKPKWQTGLDDSRIMDYLKSVDIHQLTPYQLRLFCYACIADFYSCQHAYTRKPSGVVVELDARNEQGEVKESIKIVADKGRLAEVNYVLECLRENKEIMPALQISQMPVTNKKKLELLHAAFALSITKPLRSDEVDFSDLHPYFLALFQ